MDVQDELDRRAIAATQQEQEAHARELLRTVDFGLQVQAFIDGPIGQRLIADSAAELDALRNEMCALDVETPDGMRRWRELKLQIGIVEHWQSWFTKYLTDAQAAENEYHEGEHAVEP